VQAYREFKSLPLRQIRIRVNKVGRFPDATSSMGECHLTANLTAKFVKDFRVSLRARRGMPDASAEANYSVDWVGIGLIAASLAVATVGIVIFAMN
jgi:hypothetical protein